MIPNKCFSFFLSISHPKVGNERKVRYFHISRPCWIKRANFFTIAHEDAESRKTDDVSFQISFGVFPSLSRNLITLRCSKLREFPVLVDMMMLVVREMNCLWMKQKKKLWVTQRLILAEIGLGKIYLRKLQVCNAQGVDKTSL